MSNKPPPRQPPIVGITCSQSPAQWEGHRPRFGQAQTYVHALLRAGAVPVLVPPVADPNLLQSLYDRLDGLLLSGGKDVHPQHYGEPLQELCDPTFAGRDEMELTLARWAVDGGKPLLAICRGIQVLNVALGGSLYQDIGAQVPEAGQHARVPGHPRDRLSHTISVQENTHLAHIVDATSLEVNSLHHQAIKELAPGLIVTARAPDEIIEAVEVEGHPFAISVQWHPEDLAGSDAREQRLFDTLVQACSDASTRA